MLAQAFKYTVCTLALFVTTACGSSSSTGDKPAVPSTTAANSASTTTAATPDAAASKPKRGLNAPDNDPALVALARDVLKCYRKAECEAQGKWYEPFHMGRQVDFKTLVNLLEDDSLEIRTLAASILRGKKGEPGFHADAAYATRVLDALEREKDENAAREMALAAGFIDVKATGLEERLLKIIRTDSRERVRSSMIESILDNNWDVPTVTAAVKALITDPNGNVRVSVVRAFDNSKLRAEACPFWAANLGHEDRSLVRQCYYEMISNSCKAQFDGMMDAAEKNPPDGIENFQAMCIQGGTPENVKKRLIKATETWAKNTALSGSQRAESLKVLAACDRVQAKKVAADLSKDKEEYVREKAAEIEKMPGKE